MTTTKCTDEKALRKKVICIRYTQRDSAVDAIDDVRILVKHKVPPQGYSIAGCVEVFDNDVYVHFLVKLTASCSASSTI